MLRSHTAAATAIACLLLPSVARAEPIDEQQQIVVDGVVLRFGDTIELTGVCIPTRFFGDEYAVATIRALRIGGKPTQQQIRFHLVPNDDKHASTVQALREIEHEKHYLIRGKLMNARINGSDNICCLSAEHVEPTPAADLKVADFIDREATFDGLAAPGGTLKYGEEVVSIEGLRDWPERFDGRQVSVHGTVRKGAQGLWIERPAYELYQLDDLAGQQVALKGLLTASNGYRFFKYRDERLYLTSASGTVLQFPWTDLRRSALVRGRLVKQDRPSLDSETLGGSKSGSQLVPTYVIQDARLELLGPELSEEQKFGIVYPSYHRSHSGVPELLAESSFRRNLMGGETRAMLFAERNIHAIRRMLRDISAEHRDELARRMADETTDEILRLLYAAILANANDDRGRAYLLKAAEIHDGNLDANALYCLGMFPFLADHPVDVAWAEKPLVDLMSDMNKVNIRGILGGRNDDKKVPVASAAALYSAIPSVLREVGTDACRQALLTYLTAHADASERVAMELCRWKPPLTSEELIEIDTIVEDGRVHRTILQTLLARKSPEVVDHFLNDLGQFVYLDFRDELSPELVDQLKARLNELDGERKKYAQMLIVLGGNGAVGELLKMLNDGSWLDKNIVLFELARLADARAVAPVARFLRDAPKDAVSDDGGLSATNTIRHGLEAIAHTGTSEAIRELIELLPVDLARFGGYIDRDEWRRIVAAHLIELTGESFATDVEKWRAWQHEHPRHSVPPELANPGGIFRMAPGQAVDIGQ